MPAPCASRCYSCASLAGPCARESGSDNPVSLPLCLMSRSLANKCHGRLIVLRWLFCATAESYLAFVQMESSKGESADDTYAEQLATGIAPAYSRVGEGVRLLWRKQIVWLWTACGRYTAERRKPLKSVLLGCRATFLTCITYSHARHVFCAMRMPSMLFTPLTPTVQALTTQPLHCQVQSSTWKTHKLTICYHLLTTWWC